MRSTESVRGADTIGAPRVSRLAVPGTNDRDCIYRPGALWDCITYRLDVSLRAPAGGFPPEFGLAGPLVAPWLAWMLSAGAPCGSRAGDTRWSRGSPLSAECEFLPPPRI